MFERLIEIAIKSAFENSEIKEKLNEKVKINSIKQKNKIIDLEKNESGVFEAK